MRTTGLKFIRPLLHPFPRTSEDRPVGQPLETHIRKLQEFYWSDADPEGRGFVPLADALRRSGELMEAHRLLREGLTRHPDFLAAHVVYGWVHRDGGKLDEAEHWFREALALDPKNIEALRGLGEVLLERGEIPEALGYLELLRQEDPTDLALPGRVEELKTGFADVQEEESEAEPETGPGPWTYPPPVEDEVDVESATLQPDRSAPAASSADQPDPVAWSADQTDPAGAWTDPSDGGSEGLSPGDSTAPGPAPARPTPGDPVVEDREPLPAGEDLKGTLVTPTLGEIYVRQGLYEQAEGVFGELLARDPSNESLKRRLEEVRDLRQGSNGVPEPLVKPPGRDVKEVVEEDAYKGSVGDPDTTGLGQGRGGDRGGLEVVSIQSLAPDRPGSGRREPEGEGASAETGSPAPDDVVSIDSLAPDGPVSIDSLAPDEPVSIDSLAPDEPVSIQALAPDDVVSIDSLAPDGPISLQDPASDPVVSIQDLAPDEVVSIDSLAPDGPISIQALAPDSPP